MCLNGFLDDAHEHVNLEVEDIGGVDKGRWEFEFKACADGFIKNLKIDVMKVVFGGWRDVAGG